jgi:nitrogen fixation NifU-like protein
MSEMDDQYQEQILEHHKHPRNFGGLPDANRLANGHNPLCVGQARLGPQGGYEHDVIVT